MTKDIKNHQISNSELIISTTMILLAIITANYTNASAREIGTIGALRRTMEQISHEERASRDAAKIEELQRQLAEARSEAMHSRQRTEVTAPTESKTKEDEYWDKRMEEIMRKDSEQDESLKETHAIFDRMMERNNQMVQSLQYAGSLLDRRAKQNRSLMGWAEKALSWLFGGRAVEDRPSERRKETDIIYPDDPRWHNATSISGASSDANPQSPDDGHNTNGSRRDRDGRPRQRTGR